MREDISGLINSLESWKDKFNEVDQKISTQTDGFDTAEYVEMVKDHNRLTRIVKLREALINNEDEYKQSIELLENSADEEMVELVNQEIAELNEEQKELITKIKKALLPPDPNSGKNVIVEIRAAAGGDEASLFAADLFRMYKRYAEKRNWKVEVLNQHLTEGGGYKEVVFSVAGEDAYDHLKFETGTHRVQRVPATETSGRIHTSTSTVAVLPEAEDFEVEINENDLDVQTFRSSGPGGQHVNTTDSAIRIIHKPTGLVVSCQDEKSQLKNKVKAMRVLRARLHELEQKQREQELRDERRSQIKGGDRSDKIRTYNFPDSRIVDHRISFKVGDIHGFLDGELDEMQQALIEHEESKLISDLELAGVSQ